MNTFSKGGAKAPPFSLLGRESWTEISPRGLKIHWKFEVSGGAWREAYQKIKKTRREVTGNCGKES
jgi:hypothetical protein